MDQLSLDFSSLTVTIKIINYVYKKKIIAKCADPTRELIQEMNRYWHQHEVLKVYELFE